MFADKPLLNGPGIARVQEALEATPEPLCPVCGYYDCEHATKEQECSQTT